MIYKHLGRTGIRVSALSLGSWVTFSNQVDVDLAIECMRVAYDAGVNFFDNAEVYAGGKSEEVMGAALKKLGWRRGSYLVSTKFYWGLHSGPNERNTLNRKRLMEAIDGSLKRFGLEYIDLVYCHRADPETPIEETVRAMNDMVVQGKAQYWGTSEWAADEIRAAWHIADKYGWHKPVVEQPQYNILWRDRVENEYQRLYDDIGLGLTTWSPLASGMLTGKYNDGIPAGSRGALKGYEWIQDSLTDKVKIEQVKRLIPIADKLGCTPAQFAIAWAAKNPHVSTVITGASRLEQVHENLKALDVLPKLNDEIMAQVDAITGRKKEES
ncbi:MAG: aldo/keto reductase [Chloroflexota bacterium]